MIEVNNGSQLSDFQSPAYDLCELNSIWTFKNIVRMLAGPKSAERGSSSGLHWTRARDLIRHALMGAIESRRLDPINKDWLEEELRINRSGKVVPQWEVNIYEMAKFKREDVIVWSDKERIVDTLQQQGHQIPSETVELIEKIIRLDQIKTPNTEADKSARSGKSFEGIFPAPEGTRWPDVHFTINDNASLKIKVKGKERTLYLEEIKKHFPQEQQRELLFMIIREPGGVFDKEIFKNVKGKAFQNSKNITSKLRKSLQSLFEITDDPIKWIPEKKSYVAQFSVYSDWEPYDSSD